MRRPAQGRVQGRIHDELVVPPLEARGLLPISPTFLIHLCSFTLSGKRNTQEGSGLRPASLAVPHRLAPTPGTLITPVSTPHHDPRLPQIFSQVPSFTATPHSLSTSQLSPQGPRPISRPLTFPLSLARAPLGLGARPLPRPLAGPAPSRLLTGQRPRPSPAPAPTHRLPSPRPDPLAKRWHLFGALETPRDRARDPASAPNLGGGWGNARRCPLLPPRRVLPLHLRARAARPHSPASGERLPLPPPRAAP